MINNYYERFRFKSKINRGIKSDENQYCECYLVKFDDVCSLVCSWHIVSFIVFRFYRRSKLKPSCKISITQGPAQRNKKYKKVSYVKFLQKYIIL